MSPYRKAHNSYKETPNSETLKELRYWKKQQLNTPFSTTTGTKIHYVRYADDFLIGVRGNHEKAEEIKLDVRDFLKKNLDIELNLEKTKVTNINKEAILFLGYLIKAASKKYYESKTHKREGIPQRAAYGTIKLYTPITNVIDKLRAKLFVHKTCDQGIYFGPWVNLSDYEIVIRYRSTLMGLINYYVLSDEKKAARTIKYLLTYSALHTLAAKYKTSLAKTVGKYGKKVTVKLGTKTIDLDYKPEKNKVVPITDPFQTTNYSIRTNRYLLDSICKSCGASTNVEMHHVRHLKDLNPKLSPMNAMMAKMKRKQVPLCAKCHDTVHSGKYSGPKL
jgi:hypothetical protein